MQNGSNTKQITISGGQVIDSLTEYSSLFLFSYSPKRKCLLAWSKNAEKVLGVKDIAIATEANLFLRHVHPDDRFLLISDLEKALRGEAAYRATYRWIRPDNNEVAWLHCRANLNQGGEEHTLDGVILDVSPEFTGHIVQIAGPDSIAAVLDAFPTIVFTLDRDLRILRINRARDGQLFSFQDVNFKSENFKIGRSILHCFEDQQIKRNYSEIFSKLLEGKEKHFHTRVGIDELVHNLEIVPIDEKGVISGLLCIVSDISENVRIERQLAQLQKAEGLRLLAAGVAHHFNNALQSIMGQASLISTHPDKPELLKQASQSIIDVVTRVSEMTRQLYVYEDANNNQASPVDINLATVSALNRIDNLFSLGIKVGVTFGNPGLVLAKQNELSLAIEAVIRNSVESLKSSGQITVRSYQVNLQNNEIDDLKAGTYAKLSVSDSGEGMSPEVRTRCLEPFFTTKDRDSRTGVSLEGSGLGLSKAFSVVRQYGGAITIDSNPGHGTTISFFLPLIEAVESEGNSNILQVIEPEILIIDDDLMVLRTMSTLLKDLGYNCASAESAHKGLRLARTWAKSIRLVLLDAVMPGMDGLQVLKHLRGLNKDLKIIGFSGASPEFIKPMLDEGLFEFLRKPVDPKTLAQSVKIAMGEKKAA